MRRYAGLFLVMYDSLKRSWGKDLDGVPSAARTFACSTAAGFAATLATQPFDVLRTRAQLDCSSARSIAHVAALLDQGLSVALAGFWPRLMKRTLASSVTWTVFEHTIRQLQHEARPSP
jgi:hypothetical protein